MQLDWLNRLNLKTRSQPILLILLLLIIFGCRPVIKPPQFPAEPTIRVALLTDQERVAVTATGPFTIYSGNKKETLSSGKICRISYLNTITVQGAIWLKTANFPIQIKVESNGLVSVANRTYRGYLEIRKNPTGKLTVINILPLEKYLFGVVPCEIGGLNEKTFEAGKAQAIAARSYALSHLGWFSQLGFDVFATYQRDQEYRGKSAETEMTNKAVLATYGVVALYRNKIIEAKYHSTCGGHTIGGKAPYLRALPDTPGHRKGKKPFCFHSPHYTWRKSISIGNFLKAMIKVIPNFKPKAKIRAIRLEKDRRTQRNRFVNILTNRERYKIKSEDFRRALELKTNFYSVTKSHRAINITGHGYGHGIGLCQYGALGMAKQGYKSEAIIQHYYPKTKLKRIY
uniref:SpoIID/LytB domain-containing protein n=1 Tax=candidate division WOR-3 bacterium TaxID=2052148 RepID=A0A7C6A8B8_UNCW3